MANTPHVSQATMVRATRRLTIVSGSQVVLSRGGRLGFHVPDNVSIAWERCAIEFL